MHIIKTSQSQTEDKMTHKKYSRMGLYGIV